MNNQQPNKSELTPEQIANLQRHPSYQSAQRDELTEKQKARKAKLPFIFSLVSIAIYLGIVYQISQGQDISFREALLVPLVWFAFLAISTGALWGWLKNRMW